MTLQDPTKKSSSRQCQPTPTCSNRLRQLRLLSNSSSPSNNSLQPLQPCLKNRGCICMSWPQRVKDFQLFNDVTVGYWLQVLTKPCQRPNPTTTKVWLDTVRHRVDIQARIYIRLNWTCHVPLLMSPISIKIRRLGKKLSNRSSESA